MIIFVLMLHIGMTSGLNRNIKQLQPLAWPKSQFQAFWPMRQQSWSGFEEKNESDDLNKPKLVNLPDYFDDSPEYFDNFYNHTEWEQATPSLDPQYIQSIRTSGKENLCMGHHFVPELFVIGGISSSTTSLCMELRRSPAILWPHSVSTEINESRHSGAWKEGHYFDRYYGKGKEYMINDFKKCTQEVRNVAVEGAARYSTDPGIPKLIYSWYGLQKQRLKFVWILREPLARLHSHYYHGQDDKWCYLQFGSTFKQVIQGILAGNTLSYFLTGIEGCVDFMRGSMYVDHLHNYFRFFNPSQFILVPFLYQVNPGQDGRSNQTVAEAIWSILGIDGQPGKTIQSNSHHHPPLEEDLDRGLAKKMREWFDSQTGPEKIANIVRDTEINLYEYKKDPKNATQIAHWLSTNW